jgi:transposase-like protein
MKQTKNPERIHPLRTNSVLVIEPAKSWHRLQSAKEFFLEDLDAQMKENHRRFLEELMRYERQCFLNAQPYERTDARVDQANGFYSRRLTTRLGVLDLAVPRTRCGHFQSQVLPRYQRREGVVTEALKQVFLLGVSTRQAGRALASLVEEAVSASTVSAVAKVLDQTVNSWHRRPLTDDYQYLIFDGVSVRLRLVGAVRRRVALCAYGITAQGRRELIDFLIVSAEGEDTWKSFLLDLHRRGLKGARLQLITTDGQKGCIKALKYVWPRVAHQRCWVHKLRNLEGRLKKSQRACLEEAREIYGQQHRRGALESFRAWKRRWGRSAPGAVRCVEEDLEELLAFYEVSRAHWKRVRSTNVIERLFVEVRRRIRTMCAFTTRSSCERILYSVFARMNTYWESHPLKAFTQNN